MHIYKHYTELLNQFSDGQAENQSCQIPKQNEKIYLLAVEHLHVQCPILDISWLLYRYSLS